MHAFRGHAYGPPESLRWEEVPDPPLDEGQVRIEVKASAVNFPDVLYIAGTYQIKPTPPFIPGMEVAGLVVESRAPSLPVGTRVASTLDGSGGYATHAVAPAQTTFPLPDTLPFEDAAAITITYQTGWFALHRRARIQRGDWLLVHAGAGGVGSAAIQLGKAAGAKIIATSGGAKKAQVCRELGADVAVDYTAEDFVPLVKSATLGRGADVVFDPVGGDVFDKSTKCIAFEGRIIVVGFTGGRFAEVRTNHLLVKNYSVVGLHWGLYNFVDPSSIATAQRELYRLYEERTIKPLIGARLPLREAPAAMAKMASRGTIGKILLFP
jgi:NADPH2:quinone reductase